MNTVGPFEQLSRRRTLVFGVLCAGSGAAVGMTVSVGAVGEGWGGFSFYAATAAGLTAAPLWWFALERRRRFGAARGALVGALVGLLAHYPCWYLAILGQNISYWVFGQPGSSLGEAPLDPFNGLGGALVLSFWSWLLLGWFTAIIGALVGGVYARRIGNQVRSQSDSECGR